MSSPMEVSFNAYTPQQTTEICSRVGTRKANMRADKIFFSSFIAGCYLAFSSAVCLVINTSPWVCNSHSSSFLARNI